MLTKVNFIKTFFLVGLLTVIDHFVLITIDSWMEQYVVAYQARSSYLMPNIMYFVACFITIACGLYYGWSRMLPFIYIAVAVFFPLIFINSSIEVYWEMSQELQLHYQLAVCQYSVSSAEGLCGKALAHVIFSRVISALPLLFLTPLLFYGVLLLGYFSRHSDLSNED